mgnify:CR=1 FL=1
MSEKIFKRKIYERMLQWKQESDGQTALLIKGARRIGKSTIAEEFARREYDSYINIDFSIADASVKELFSHISDLDYFFLRIQSLFNVSLHERKSVIIFDEVQLYPPARQAIKHLVKDRRYDYIETGSLLSIKKNVKGIVIPSEETRISMYPLDFEEFLWANGITDGIIDMLKKSMDTESPVPEPLHNRMRQLLLQYTVVGGMPDAVQTFVDTKQMDEVLKIQRDIVRSYEDDMVKYAERKDKSKIKECFQSIPKQLSKENKKFQYSVVKKGGRASQYIGSIQWLEDAGIVRRCYNTQITELPLEGNSIKECFKVYTTDIGVLMAMLDYGTQADILKGNLLGYKGAIFENLMADFLCKSGQKLYYFHKDSGLELDFLVRFKGECVILEVKSKSGKAKSMTTVLKNKNVYHVKNAIKLGQYNVGREGEILTIPLYMGFLVKDKIADAIIPDVDLSLLTTI